MLPRPVPALQVPVCYIVDIVEVGGGEGGGVVEVTLVVDDEGCSGEGLIGTVPSVDVALLVLI